jgi:hypothetical protein
VLKKEKKKKKTGPAKSEKVHPQYNHKIVVVDNKRAVGERSKERCVGKCMPLRIFLLSAKSMNVLAQFFCLIPPLGVVDQLLLFDKGRGYLFGK